MSVQVQQTFLVKEAALWTFNRQNMLTMNNPAYRLFIKNEQMFKKL